MKNRKSVILVLLIGIIIIYLYLNFYTDIFKNNLFSNFLMIAIIVILSLNIILDKEINSNIKIKDKLFSSLIESLDTVYIMFDMKERKTLYLSNNVEEVLGINCSNKSIDDISYQILNSQSIKSELSNWDKNSEYISQMFEYDNPRYNHQMWIRIKIFPYKDKTKNYYILQIVDSTKEHEKQHLLISQATNIKARESQLNQITASTYDVEMNINLLNNSYDLKYFKKDNLYFGEEKRGTYTTDLKNILNYINENDREYVYSNLNIENLKQHFDKYELDSIIIRYRLGSELKNNTWLESTIFFISNRHNNKVSILTKNVTESAESIREQNIMLQNALNDAKLANKTKTDLISTISHDIRTPLTNIIGLSDTLLEKDMPKNIKEDISNINTSSEEVLEIIDGLLDTSKIEKELIKKQEKNYSILKLFKKLETSTLDYIGDKPIKLNLNLDSNLPVILYGDSKRITQALTEVLNNSVKYTNEGKIDINVRGEKKDNNVELYIEVIDTGIGIDDEKLSNIFNSKESKSGLDNVKNLINLLDGKLEIESKINEYTKVALSFTQEIVEDNKIREMMKNNKTAEEFSLKGKKILIVDDNKLNLKVTKRLLESYEVETILLESGQECLDIIKEQNNFDLILLDQMMPGIDGTTTMKKLKEIKEFNTPIVVLTADAMVGQKEKYLSEGFDDYISKPIDKSELSRILKKFIKD